MVCDCLGEVCDMQLPCRGMWNVIDLVRYVLGNCLADNSLVEVCAKYYIHKPTIKRLCAFGIMNTVHNSNITGLKPTTDYMDFLCYEVL